MTLAIRVIPSLLVRGSSLVKGQGFDASRVVGHPLQAARIHQARGVDELLYLDVAATPENRGHDFAQIEKLTEGCLMPLTVGGGVRSCQDIDGLLRAGADKVLICTEAAGLVREASDRYGSQCIVAGIDVHGGKVALRCGHESTRIDPVARARKLAKAGAGEILLQTVERDGMMKGYDLALIKRVAEVVNIPVIASCGAGSYDHMVEAVRAGASAVAAGALFQFTENTPAGAAAYLIEKGLPARV